MRKFFIYMFSLIVFSINLYAEQTPEQFVERLYQNVLNRQSDAAGLNDWVNRLRTESGASVASGFFNSQELANRNLSDVEYLNVLYRTLFDRDADQNGILGWIDRMNNGLSRERVQHGFYNSQEFSNLADSFGVTAIRDDEQLEGVGDFVNRFYRLVLGREADPAGFNDWVNQLNSGTRSGTDIANGFFNSPEYVNRGQSNEDFLNTLYQAFFNRAADAGGYQSWMESIANGATRQNIIDGFSNSQEFENLANEYGISATLETGNLLGNVQDYSTRSSLPGINVSLYDSTNALVQSTTTDSNGNYVFQNLTQGNYVINFSSENYIDAYGRFNILANANNVFSQVLMPQISADSTQGSLSGYVKDAFSGNSLIGVTVTLYSGLNITAGDVISSTVTGNSGYTLDGLNAGYYTVVLSKEGYISVSYPVTVGGNNMSQNNDYTISPVLASDEVRAVLTWGERPSDLDSHIAYLEEGIRQYHIYYSNKSNFSYWNNIDTNRINLDTDDTSSYGPETVTVTKMSLNGNYKYYVHDYSTYSDGLSNVISNSGASVKVYFGNNTYTFNVPSGQGTVWKVFEINNGVLTPCINDCIFNIEDTNWNVENSSDFGARNISRHSTITSEEFSLFENLPSK